MRRLAGKAIANVGLKGCSVVLLFALSVILARILGADGYGKYAYVIGILTLLSVPAKFGIPILILRRIAQYETSRQWGLLLGVIRLSGQAVLVLTATTVLIAALVYVLFFTSDQRATSGLLLWGLVFMLFLNCGQFCGAVLTGFRRPLEGAFPMTIVRPLLFVVTVAVLVEMFAINLSPSRAMALNAAATAVGFCAAAILMMKRLPAQVKRTRPDYHSREWLLSLIPLALMAGAQVVNGKVDIVVLGSLASNSEVGVYRAALRFAQLAPFLGMAVLWVMGPQASRLYVRRDGRQLQRLLTLTARLTIFMRVPLTACYLIVPGWLLVTAYGEEFSRGAEALRILALGGFFTAIMGAPVMVLNMTGHEKSAAKVVGIGAVINLLLNLLLVPGFGMVGSAIATTSSRFATNLLLVVYIRRRLGLWSAPFGARWADTKRLSRP